MLKVESCLVGVKAFFCLSLFINLGSIPFGYFNEAMALPADPFIGLEEIESENSLKWVNEQNALTVEELEKHPSYQGLYSDLEQILFADDRIPFASYYQGSFWNFWQDASHKHGILRRTTLEEYRKEQPLWDTVLDLDELSRLESENWVYKGNVRLDMNSPLGLVYLSRGGKDAVVVREFDFRRGKFVEDGFVIPEAKTSVTPLDENHLLIGTDFGPESLTDSRYPRVIKVWQRGQPLSSAQKVFEVGKPDLSAQASLIRDGAKKYVLFHRAIDFYNSETYLQVENQKLQKLSIPSSGQLLGIKNSYGVFLVKHDFISLKGVIPQNSVVRFKIEEGNLDNAEIVFSANNRQSIEDVQLYERQIYINLLDNVRSKLIKLEMNSLGQWEVAELGIPLSGEISLSLKSDQDPSSYSMITYTDYLTPPRQYLLRDKNGSFSLELLKKAPSRFDESKFEVFQDFATSADGTEVPYSVLRRKGFKADGSHPTVLYGYGGFEMSLTPFYSGSIGKLWLERGGVWVVANIRGGGEFGPSWHDAALKENRQKSFDDFIAVAEDLIAKKITSPEHLGIEGGSNGGLLVGATMVQRPDLFNAALIKVPLLDMLRYSKLLAGASWMGEYGDPERSEDCRTLLKYSPYHNVKVNRVYPKPMFTTSTKDDRVHPAHARKMAARMLEQGHDLYYYENTNGGHAGSANLNETLRMLALEYTYLWSRLR